MREPHHAFVVSSGVEPKTISSADQAQRLTTPRKKPGTRTTPELRAESSEPGLLHGRVLRSGPIRIGEVADHPVALNRPGIVRAIRPLGNCEDVRTTRHATSNQVVHRRRRYPGTSSRCSILRLDGESKITTRYFPRTNEIGTLRCRCGLSSHDRQHGDTRGHDHCEG